MKYVELKDTLAEALIRSLAPLRERREAIAADRAAIRRVLAEGAEKARAIARATLDEVRQRIGIGRAFRGEA